MGWCWCDGMSWGVGLSRAPRASLSWTAVQHSKASPWDSLLVPQHTTCHGRLLVHSQLWVMPRVPVLISGCKSRSRQLAKASLLPGFCTGTWENLAVGVCVMRTEALGPSVMPSSGTWESCIGSDPCSSGGETKVSLKFSFHLLGWYFVSKL